MTLSAIVISIVTVGVAVTMSLSVKILRKHGSTPMARGLAAILMLIAIVWLGYFVTILFF
jgi:ABC-type sulfate transport system permease subunit